MPSQVPPPIDIHRLTSIVRSPPVGDIEGGTCRPVGHRVQTMKTHEILPSTLAHQGVMEISIELKHVETKTTVFISGIHSICKLVRVFLTPVCQLCNKLFIQDSKIGDKWFTVIFIFFTILNIHNNYIYNTDGTAPGEASGKDLVACVDSVGADAVSGLRQDVVQISRIPDVSIPVPIQRCTKQEVALWLCYLYIYYIIYLYLNVWSDILMISWVNV